MILHKDVLNRSKVPNLTISWLAEQMEMSRNSFYFNLKNPKLEFLQKVADLMGMYPLELLDPGAGYQHFYDSESGEWMGIRKK